MKKNMAIRVFCFGRIFLNISCILLGVAILCMGCLFNYVPKKTYTYDEAIYLQGDINNDKDYYVTDKIVEYQGVFKVYKVRNGRHYAYRRRHTTYFHLVKFESMEKYAIIATGEEDTFDEYFDGNGYAYKDVIVKGKVIDSSFVSLNMGDANGNFDLPSNINVVTDYYLDIIDENDINTFHIVGIVIILISTVFLVRKIIPKKEKKYFYECNTDDISFTSFFIFAVAAVIMTYSIYRLVIILNLIV